METLGLEEPTWEEAFGRCPCSGTGLNMQPRQIWPHRYCKTGLFAQATNGESCRAALGSPGGTQQVGLSVLVVCGCLLNPSPALLSCQGRGCQRTFPSPRLAAGRAGCGQAASPLSQRDDGFEGLGDFLWLPALSGQGPGSTGQGSCTVQKRVQTLSAPELWQSKLDLDHLFSSVNIDVWSFHPHMVMMVSCFPMWLCSSVLVCSEHGETFMDQSRAVCRERTVHPAARWAQGHDQLKVCMGNPCSGGTEINISVTIDTPSAVGQCCSTKVCCVVQVWARGCAPHHWQCFAGSDRSGEPQLGLAASPGDPAENSVSAFWIKVFPFCT